MKYSKDILLLMIDETLNELEECKIHWNVVEKLTVNGKIK